MNALRNATRNYTHVLEAFSSTRRQLVQAKQSLSLLDAELSETISEANDELGKPVYSNADARKAALLTHPKRVALSHALHQLELEAIAVDARLEVAKVEWQAERLIHATDHGLVAI